MKTIPFLALLLLASSLTPFATAAGQDQIPDQVKQRLLKNPEIIRIREKFPKAEYTKSGLHYIVTQKGLGEETPKRGRRITAHYHGTLLNGSKFDSSYDRGQPFQFQVGIGQVIRGWDEAFLAMKKGEKRTLIIPSNLAYGPRGAGGVIPPNATLIFEVELIDF